jgi:hypothetical protein
MNIILKLVTITMLKYYKIEKTTTTREHKQQFKMGPQKEDLNEGPSIWDLKIPD